MREISSSIVIAFVALAVRCEGQRSTENDTTSEEIWRWPKYWRAILGDVCQLPSFPYATSDPTRYLECVAQNGTINERADVGIWLLRECPPEHIFAAPAGRCLTLESVVQWIKFCEGPNATNSSQCLPNNKQNARFIIQEEQLQSQHCKCSNDEENCTCPKAEVFEPVLVNNAAWNEGRNNATQFDASNLPPCAICPSSSSDCFCPVESESVLLQSASQKSQSVNQPRHQAEQILPQRLQLIRQRRQQQAPAQQMPSTQQSNVRSDQVLQLAASAQQLNMPSNANCECPETACICININSACQTTTTQQSYCPQQSQQNSVLQPQACPLVQGQTSQTAEYQGICSWMLDRLAVDPQGITTYLQCQPTTNDVYCGRWQRMPCSPGTTFDVNVQLCVWHSGSQAGQASVQTPSLTVSVPAVSSSQCVCTTGVLISPCGENNQCPGQSACQIDTQCSICCYIRV